MRKRTIAVIGVVVTLCALGCRTPVKTIDTRPAVSDLLRQVQSHYQKMQSYQSTGELTENMSTAWGRMDEKIEFSVKLERPDLYRIEWEAHMPNQTWNGAVWSAGDGNFVTGPGMAKPAEPKDMVTALAMATGISGGAAYTLPGIFFGLEGNQLQRLDHAIYKKDEIINGEPCFVIAGKSAVGVDTIWISKNSKLILRTRVEIKGLPKFPAMTDEQIKETLHSMNKTPTPEAIKQMKAQMDFARTWVEASGMTGVTTQVYRQIIVNAELRKTDFIVHVANQTKTTPPPS